MKRHLQPISLAGFQLGEVRHVCAFFANNDEEYRVLLPFIKEGLERGDKAIQVVNPQQRDEHLRRLDAAGIDSAAAQQAGQLEIKINTEAYLPDGKFDPDRMLETFEKLASGNETGGFALSRIVCRMDWVVGDRSRLEQMVFFYWYQYVLFGIATLTRRYLGQRRFRAPTRGSSTRAKPFPACAR